MATIASNVACLTNIQRYSINDGPGIRTTVFLKGCPLNCQWCHNPECINHLQEIFFTEAKCRRCGLCNANCPENAMYPPSEGPQEKKINRERCTRCMKCVEVCPFGALSKAGYNLSLDEVLREVERDAMFYENSGGGVTISGGEPLFQPTFTEELLKRCKEELFHTAIESCGYARWKVIEGILDYLDLALYDIKHMDARRHLEGTGISNELILDNAQKIAARVPTRVRIPLIPGFNDSPENLEMTARFCRSLSKLEGVDILPFHSWAAPKYRKLEWEKGYVYAHVPDMKEEDAKRAEEIFKKHGFPTTIGG